MDSNLVNDNFPVLIPMARQQYNKTTEEEIPQALEEKDINKSVNKMKGAW